MVGNLLLGLVGGFLGARLMARMGRRCGGGRCGGGGGGGMRQGWGRFGGFGGRRAFFLLRELSLDVTQKAQVKDLFHTARRAMGEARFGRMELLSSLVDAARGDKFDRAAVETASHKQGEAESAARKEFIDKLELFVNGLTSEQRAKVQEFLATLGHPMHDHHQPPAGGAAQL